MELTILGSGTIVPSAERNTAGYAVRFEGSEEILLFDCGPGTLHRMAEAGIRPPSVRWVVLTHFHPDHNLDLVALLFSLASPLFGLEGHPLTIVGPAGTAKLVEAFRTAYGAWIEPPGVDLEIREIGPGRHALGGATLGAHRVLHTPQSLAYRLEEGGAALTYSGDTGYCAGIVEAASGTDVLLLECSFTDELAMPTHLTPRLCGRIAREARPAKLVLTHFYPVFEGVDIEAEVRREFDGAVVLARDLMRLAVGGSMP